VFACVCDDEVDDDGIVHHDRHTSHSERFLWVPYACSLRSPTGLGFFVRGLRFGFWCFTGV